MNQKAKEFLEEIEKEERNKTIKLFNKQNFSIASLAPNKNTYQQEFIHITDNYTEVTNGHYLCRITTQSIAKEDLPINNGLKPNNKEIEMLIDKDSAKKIEQNIPTDKDAPPTKFLKSTWVGKNTNEDKAEFIMTDIVNWTPINVQKQEGRYYNTDAIIESVEKDKAVIEIGFNVEYMKKLCDQVIKLQSKRYTKCARLSIYGAEKAMKIEAKTDDTETEKEQKMIIILMPMKID